MNQSEATGRWSAGGEYGAQPDDQHRYVVRIAPAVLATIVRLAVEQVPGVSRLANTKPSGRGWRGGSSYAGNGLRLAVRDGRVRAAVHLVIVRDHNLQAVGTAVQEAVASALDNLVGMSAETIDVYVQGVD